MWILVVVAPNVRCAILLLLLLVPAFAENRMHGPLLEEHGVPIYNLFDAEVAEKDKYIVVFKDWIEAEHVTKVSRAILASGGGSLVHHPQAAKPQHLRYYNKIFKGFSATLTASQVTELRKRAHDVRFIERVTEVHLANPNGAQESAPWNLVRVNEPSGDIAGGTYTWTSSGCGVDVYIIDSGLYTEHSEFEGRATCGYDLTASEGTAGGCEDCDGHGTHVAGLVGGKTYGVAKDANLISVKIIDCYGAGDISLVTQAVEWVLLNLKGPSVLSMSLSGQKSESMNMAIETAFLSYGVLSIVAAGNLNSDACTQSPASSEHALSVGATDILDTIADFSDWGPCVDIFAPGVDILSAWIGDPEASVLNSGTSMSTPLVSGVAALYLSYRPNASPSEVADAIISSAQQGAVMGELYDSANLFLQTSLIGNDFKTPFKGYCADSCPDDCTQRGTCTRGECSCFSSTFGSWCQFLGDYPSPSLPVAQCGTVSAAGLCSSVTSGTTYNAWPVVSGTNGTREQVLKFSLSEPQRVTISTCSPLTDYDSLLWLYNSCPINNPAIAPFAHNDDNSYCDANVYSSVLDVFLQNGTYFVVVSGYSGSEGNFALTINTAACAVPSIPPPPPTGTSLPTPTRRRRVITATPPPTPSAVRTTQVTRTPGGLDFLGTATVSGDNSLNTLLIPVMGTLVGAGGLVLLVALFMYVRHKQMLHRLAEEKRLEEEEEEEEYESEYDEDEEDELEEEESSSPITDRPLTAEERLLRIQQTKFPDVPGIVESRTSPGLSRHQTPRLMSPPHSSRIRRPSLAPPASARLSAPASARQPSLPRPPTSDGPAPLEGDAPRKPPAPGKPVAILINGRIVMARPLPPGQKPKSGQTAVVLDRKGIARVVKQASSISQPSDSSSSAEPASQTAGLKERPTPRSPMPSSRRSSMQVDPNVLRKSSSAPVTGPPEAPQPSPAKGPPTKAPPTKAQAPAARGKTPMKAKPGGPKKPLPPGKAPTAKKPVSGKSPAKPGAKLPAKPGVKPAAPSAAKGKAPAKKGPPAKAAPAPAAAKQQAPPSVVLVAKQPPPPPPTAAPGSKSPSAASTPHLTPTPAKTDATPPPAPRGAVAVAKGALTQVAKAVSNAVAAVAGQHMSYAVAKAGAAGQDDTASNASSAPSSSAIALAPTAKLPAKAKPLPKAAVVPAPAQQPPPPKTTPLSQVTAAATKPSSSQAASPAAKPPSAPPSGPPPAPAPAAKAPAPQGQPAKPPPPPPPPAAPTQAPPAKPAPAQAPSSATKPQAQPQPQPLAPPTQPPSGVGAPAKSQASPAKPAAPVPPQAPQTSSAPPVQATPAKPPPAPAPAPPAASKPSAAPQPPPPATQNPTAKPSPPAPAPAPSAPAPAQPPAPQVKPPPPANAAPQSTNPPPAKPTSSQPPPPVPASTPQAKPSPAPPTKPILSSSSSSSSSVKPIDPPNPAPPKADSPDAHPSATKPAPSSKPAPAPVPSKADPPPPEVHPSSSKPPPSSTKPDPPPPPPPPTVASNPTPAKPDVASPPAASPPIIKSPAPSSSTPPTKPTVDATVKEVPAPIPPPPPPPPIAPKKPSLSDASPSAEKPPVVPLKQSGNSKPSTNDKPSISDKHTGSSDKPLGPTHKADVQKATPAKPYKPKVAAKPSSTDAKVSALTARPQSKPVSEPDSTRQPPAAKTSRKPTPGRPESRPPYVSSLKGKGPQVKPVPASITPSKRNPTKSKPSPSPSPSQASPVPPIQLPPEPPSPQPVQLSPHAAIPQPPPSLSRTVSAPTLVPSQPTGITIVPNNEIPTTTPTPTPNPVQPAITRTASVPTFGQSSPSARALPGQAVRVPAAAKPPVPPAAHPANMKAPYLLQEGRKPSLRTLPNGAQLSPKTPSTSSRSSVPIPTLSIASGGVPLPSTLSARPSPTSFPPLPASARMAPGSARVAPGSARFAPVASSSSAAPQPGPSVVAIPMAKVHVMSAGGPLPQVPPVAAMPIPIPASQLTNAITEKPSYVMMPDAQGRPKMYMAHRPIGSESLVLKELPPDVMDAIVRGRPLPLPAPATLPSPSPSRHPSPQFQGAVPRAAVPPIATNAQLSHAAGFHSAGPLLPSIQQLRQGEGNSNAPSPHLSLSNSSSVLGLPRINAGVSPLRPGPLLTQQLPPPPPPPLPSTRAPTDRKAAR
eukprot:CAMPEP_0184651122 /NCGR_PEP_ID=MMETSP0308-20130426/8699_1 /TAXON_ID=38269 /ORGANISM="Gloeochaete witrockiana, Strain SAG 46.84" /LENGTH=2163 /DNA_ID=CAMNT_0027085117 /DNA_START=217 /DNA_END=6708 /DNA_ORIENTATION=+